MITKEVENKIYTLRIDPKIFEIISEHAKRNKRSIAKEIEYRLEQSLKTESKL